MRCVMGRGKCAFKATDVTKAVKAVEAAGKPVRGVRFEPSGFTVVIGEPGEAIGNQSATEKANDDVENWIRKNDAH